MKRRVIERIRKEDEGGEMKVVVPPVDSGRPPPADRVAIRLEAQPPARRKHRRGTLPGSAPKVVPSAWLAFSPPA